MFGIRLRFLPATFVCAAAFGAGTVWADNPPTTQIAQMQTRIDQLEAKVQTLEARDDQNSVDVAAAIQQVMSDAQSNSNLMGSIPLGAGSGWDEAGGFHLGSDDGNFYIHPIVLLQVRGVVDYRQGVQANETGADAPDKGTNTQTGFEIRRLKLGADGHLYSPNLGYFFMFNTFRKGGGLSLEDAYATYRLGDTSPLTIQAGQFKDIAWHESNVGDSFQLAAEESMLNALIGGTYGGTGGLGSDQARVQGVALQYKQGAIRGEVALHDGYGSQNTAFFDTTENSGGTPGGIIGAPQPTNWGVSGRTEYMVIGNDSSWTDYGRFSAYGDKSDLLVAGAGLDYTEAGSSKMLDWTADAQYNTPSGLDIYGAFLGQYLADSAVADPAHISSTANSYGWLVQGGYLVSPQWEPFVRYDFTHLDGNLYTIAGLIQHNDHEITVGVNYYIHGHDCKVTFDGSYLPNGAPADMDGLGYLTDNDRGEWVFRAQFQLKI